MLDNLNFDWLDQANIKVAPWLPDIAPSIEMLASQLVFALIVSIIINVVLNQSRSLITVLQQKLYKSKVSRKIKFKLGGFLRNLSPNFPWLCGCALGLIYLAYINKNTLFDILIIDFIILYTIFRISLLISTYSIEHAYSVINQFASKSTLKKLYQRTKVFSYQTTFLFFPLLVIDSNIVGSIAIKAILLLIFLLILKIFISIAAEHETPLKRFVSKQLPSNNVKHEQAINAAFIFYLFLSHCLTFILSIHKGLLGIKVYQQLTAKILWLHLDQKQQDSDDIDEISDESYGSWFQSSYLPEKIMATDNIKNIHEKINTIVDIWLTDKSSENNLLLHGKRGIGKSTLINDWANTSDSSEIIKFTHLNYRDISENNFVQSISRSLGLPLNTLEDLITVDNTLEKTIVVIDNCENLFLSKIGGFKSYQLMLSMINMPLKNIFWVFVIGTETHKVLNDIFGSSNQFSHCLEMQPWKSEEIREVIMARHHLSKRKLTFDELMFASMGNDEYSSYAATADRCFLILAEQCNGNPSLAIASWYKASSKKDNYKIEIGLPEKANLSFLNNCSPDLLFIYASLINHKHLSLKDAYESTRQSEAVALRAFKFGVDQGFLVQNDRQEFSIRAYWHFQMISFLTSKNYLTGL